MVQKMRSHSVVALDDPNFGTFAQLAAAVGWMAHPRFAYVLSFFIKKEI
jgi:hypothetical protein